MAKLVGVLNTSHQWIARDPLTWNDIRRGRKLRADVPMDSEQENRDKAARIATAAKAMKDKLAELDPDVLVVFGDDQGENFPTPEMRVMPLISVFVGAHFAGVTYEHQRVPVAERELQMVPNHQPLAKALLKGLIDRDFDPAFCFDLPNPEVGVGHAIMHPLGYYTDYTIPTIPIVVNAIYAPSLTGKRAYQLGTAVRQVIDAFDDDLRVVVIGSGGLWHTTVAPQGWLNEEFDRVAMSYLRSGDIKAMAEHFDAYDCDGDESQRVERRSATASGMAAMPGPQHGTREELDWIAAAATADGSAFTVLDVVPVYASPIDIGFAYCDEIR